MRDWKIPHPNEPRYVHRDKDGKVLGHYSHPNLYATEKVASDHPDIKAWDAERMRRRGAVPKGSR